jgi:hypothetical protein
VTRARWWICTHLIDDGLGKLVDLTRQTEARERDRKIDTLLSIINTLVNLLDRQGRQGIRDTLRDGDFEGVENGA